MSIQIGKSLVGPGQRPFIIAEVGSNWHTIEDCMQSITEAKKSGADAVKFQAFTFASLYGLGKGHAPATYSKNYELPLEWIPQLKNRADSLNIEFMCTAFDTEIMRAVDPYVNAHKIASSDINHIELLECAARLRKPVILSTGATTEAALTMALSVLQGCNVMLMYCVAAYPAKYVNLFVIDELKKITPDVGFSDHTVDFLYTPMSAVRNHGAVAIEKHFSCVAKDTPDAFHSLDAREFATMVDYVHGKKSSKLGPLESEREMLLKHKRRLVATREIKDGERLILNENYGVYRIIYADTSALSPHMAKEVNGLQVRMRLEPGQPITPLHVNV